MASKKCVVEGCHLEYDVICSFSFFNTNITNASENARQEWIEGAMETESECLWRHVNLQLCGYHFELDTQGLWIDSPMMPELLTVKYQEKTPEEAAKVGAIMMEHNYCYESSKLGGPDAEDAVVSRLNVRQLVDTLGYLSLKSLQRKQLWVVKVETDKTEASITQSEQVITKMTDPKQIIELIPNIPQPQEPELPEQNEVLEVTEETTVPDDFIYEIAEEQEITMDEVKDETPLQPQEWTVNIVTPKPKYAYIKHCTSGKKKRHFTAEMNQITLQGDYENYYILPDADPSVGVEITTSSYEPENYIVEEYQHLVLEEDRPKKKREPTRKRKKMTMREQVKHIKSEIGDDWVIENNISASFEDNSDDEKKCTTRVRRKNKKYLGYDFVT